MRKKNAEILWRFGCVERELSLTITEHRDRLLLKRIQNMAYYGEMGRELQSNPGVNDELSLNTTSLSDSANDLGPGPIVGIALACLTVVLVITVAGYYAYAYTKEAPKRAAQYEKQDQAAAIVEFVTDSKKVALESENCNNI